MPLRWAAWLSFGLMLAILVPPFLCMGLDVDSIGYDVQARGLRQGGVPYRDFVEVNLPGAVWLHAALRSVAGEGSAPLRMFDLAAFAAGAWLLARWTGEPAGSAWFVVALAAPFLVYFSVSEWCHCQRDIWTLPLALAATELRRRQALALAAGKPPDRFRAALEGVLWSLAFWIKPFVVAAGVAVWASAFRWANAGRRRSLSDLASLLAGGFAAVGIGCGWLIAAGAWPAFMEVVFVWNREYAKPQANLELFRQVGQRLAPWWLAHAAGIPLAARALGNLGRARTAESLARGLPAALYGGWFAQAMLMQHPWDYVQLPPALLALALGLSAARTLPTRALALALLAGATAWRYADALPAQQAAWPRCFREGSSPALRDALTRTHRLEWTRLAEVAANLGGRNVGPGSVTCLQMETLPVADLLRLPCSTRYVFLAAHLHLFKPYRERLLAELAASRQQWLVCDLLAFGISRTPAELPQDPAGLPAAWPAPRWRDRLAFRSGRYAVFRVDAAEMPAWLADNLDFLRPAR